MTQIYAAIDIGTNNCRLLIARPSTTNGIRVVGSFSRIVRLGEGVSESRRLNEQAMGRAVEALKICATKAATGKALRTWAVATEACRRAENRQVFIDRVKEETGIVIDIISARREACLTLDGCAPLLNKDVPFGLVFDIGGGSVEVIWVETRKGSKPRLIDTVSLQLGVVSLAERYGFNAIGKNDYAMMMEFIDKNLVDFDTRHSIGHRIAENQVQMLGTSGTVTMLGGIYLNLAHYSRARVDGLDMDFDTIAEINSSLVAMSAKSRTEYPCIGHGRADLAGAGCVILDAICRRWPVGTLRAADRGIREGLLLSMFAEDSAYG